MKERKRKQAGIKLAKEVGPLEPVKSRSSVQSTHSTALGWPSATWTHCSVDQRLPLEDGRGLMTPLGRGEVRAHTHTHKPK